MGLFLPFAWRATKMEDPAQTQVDVGSFYPSIHFAWQFGAVDYEVARPIYMQASFANDLFKGGWSAPWESTDGPQQLTGSKGWDASFAAFQPGNHDLGRWLVGAALGPRECPCACEGAVVYRLAHADHYFFIHYDAAKQVYLNTKGMAYKRVADPVSGEMLPLGGPIALEAHSGRWLRMEK